MLNLVIFGPPGSGKGTQSEKIIDKYKLIHLSTGDVLRAEIASGSDLGKQISALIDDGNLVPDEMIQAMVKAFILKHKDGPGIIFDGFPRTYNQGLWLKNLLNEMNEKVHMMISLDVPHDELHQRILSRGKYSGREDDRNSDIIRNRIEIYHKQTEPVKIYYKERDKYKKVNGMGSVDEIFGRIEKLIDEIN
jgi:adenylate kinase